MLPQVFYLKTPQADIAYQKLNGINPGIVFCCGYMSDMSGAKASYLAELCREQQRSFLRFDYRGHGQSTGDMLDANISAWLTDTLAALDNLTEGPIIMVGSSMGAWLALLAARLRPARVMGFVGIAAAPDFTEDLIWQNLPEDMRVKLQRNETLYFPSRYSSKPCAITWQLIEDGRRHLLLRAPFAVQCPVHLLHGAADHDIPWQTSMRLLEKIKARDVKLTLIKEGDHRLSRAEDLAALKYAVNAMLIFD